MIEKFREWQRNNPEWELLCDISQEKKDLLFETWSTLPKCERMHWVGTYRESAKSAWEEFGVARCNFEVKYLSNDLKLCDVWPTGNAMTVYKTGTLKL
jgi:hypothetical protein